MLRVLTIGLVLGLVLQFSGGAIAVARPSKRPVIVPCTDGKLRPKIRRALVALDAESEANGPSSSPAYSEDGSTLAFTSTATNLLAGLSYPADNTASQVYVLDEIGQEIDVASVNRLGDLPTANSFAPSVSGNGRFVAFASDASSLVTGDNNGSTDIFVFDSLRQRLELVSKKANGVIGNAASTLPSISDDGRFVAFRSDAGNFGGNDEVADIFVKDLDTGALTYLSHHKDGSQNGVLSTSPAISGNGAFVAFQTQGALVNADDNVKKDVYRVPVSDTTVVLVSKRNNGNASNADSTEPAVSFDGSKIAYTTRATNIAGSDTNGYEDVMLWSAGGGGSSTRVSVETGGGQATGGDSDQPDISSSGQLVAFSSAATSLFDEGNGLRDIFEWDTGDSTLGILSVGPGDLVADGGDSTDPTIVGSGAVTAFTSSATNLVGEGDTNLVPDVYTHTWVDFQLQGREECKEDKKTRPIPPAFPILPPGDDDTEWDEDCQPEAEAPAPPSGVPLTYDEYAVHATSGVSDAWVDIVKPLGLTPPVENVVLRLGTNKVGYVKIATKHGWGPVVKSQVTETLTLGSSSVQAPAHQKVIYTHNYQYKPGITCVRFVTVQFKPDPKQVAAEKPAWSITSTWARPA